MGHTILKWVYFDTPVLTLSRLSIVLYIKADTHNVKKYPLICICVCLLCSHAM